MAAYKICSIFMVLFLIQAACAKPLDDSANIFDSSEEEMRKNPTPIQKLMLYTADNFMSLGKHYAANAVKVSHNILRDQTLIANNKPEVLEFKKNLTLFVEKYEINKKPELVWDILEIFTDTTNNYSEIPEDKVTPESTFIVDLLDKYNTKEVAIKFATEFKTFLDNFVILFEENKNYLEKPMLDWYEKFQTLTNYEEKIDAFSGFIDLA